MTRFERGLHERLAEFINDQKKIRKINNDFPTRVRESPRDRRVPVTHSDQGDEVVQTDSFLQFVRTQ